MGTIKMRRLWEKFVINSLLKFIVVGGCSTCIDFIIYMFLALKLPITVSKGISMVAASVFSYILNKQFTFENKEKTNVSYLVRFYIIFGANFGTNLAVNQIIFDETGYKTIAFILATVCGMMVNYLGQKFFVFHQ